MESLEERKKVLKAYFTDKKKLYFSLFILVLLIAGGIKGYYFLKVWDQGLWYDEADYVVRAKSFKLDEFEGRFSEKKPFLMPTIWGVIYYFGGTDFAMKFVVLLLSLAGVAFVYLLGKELYDEKVGLIASFFLAVFWMHTFFTPRLLLDVPALTTVVSTSYFFWKWLKGKGNLNIIWAAISGGIGFLIFYTPSVIVFAFLVLIIINQKLNFLKNKYVWAAVIVGLLTISPWLIWNYSHTGNPIFGFSKYAGTGSCLEGYDCGLMGYLRVLPQGMRTPLLLTFIVGLGYALLDLVLGFDLLWKGKEKKLVREVFLLLWMILIIGFFVQQVKHVEDRYIITAFVPAFYLAANVITKAADYLKKYHQLAGIIFIAIMLVIIAYPQMTFAHSTIMAKKESFAKERDAGLWLKDHTQRGDVIITCNEGPPIMAFSERVVESFETNATLADEIIEKYKSKYVVLNAYFGGCLFNYPELRPGKLKPVQAFFIDKENKQPVIVIYEVVR